MQRWRISIHFAPVKDVPDLVTGLLIAFSDDHPPPDSHAKYTFEQGQAPTKPISDLQLVPLSFLTAACLIHCEPLFRSDGDLFIVSSDPEQRLSRHFVVCHVAKLRVSCARLRQWSGSFMNEDDMEGTWQ